MEAAVKEPTIEELIIGHKVASADVVTEPAEIEGQMMQVTFIIFEFDSGFIFKTPLTPHTQLGIPETPVLVQ
jgi:hypothetical protein